MTEKRQQEDEIRRSGEFVETLLETSAIPIYVTAKETGRFLMANKATADLNRLTQEELYQRSSKERYFDIKTREEIVRQLEKTGRL